MRLIHSITAHSSARIGIAVIALWLAAELALSVFTPFWDRLLEARLEKMAQYERFLRSDEIYDYVFIGSSTTLMGIDPRLIDQATSRHSFNAGQLGYAAPNVSHAVASEIIAAGKTRTLVYAVDSWAGALVWRDRQLEDRHGRSSHMLWLSNVFRNRSVFFFWVGQLVHGRWIAPSQAWYLHLMASRRFASYEGVVNRPAGYLEAHGRLDPDWPAYFKPALFTEDRLAELKAILEECRRGGVRLVLVRLPEFIRTYRENPAQHRALSEQLKGLALSDKAIFIDYSQPGTFPHDRADLFFDMHHMNSTGAVVLSRLLATDLTRLDTR